MTVAVLVTGQERSLRRVIRLLRQNLLDPNKVVLFFACETSDPVQFQSHFDGLEIGGADLRTTFRDPEFQVLTHMLWVSKRPGLSKDVFTRSGEPWTIEYIWNSGTLLQYYQLWKAWLLLLEYERTHGMTFSTVVRCRPDSLLTERIDLSRLTTAEDELTCRSMGSERIRSVLGSRTIHPEYEHPFGHPFADKVVWTLGHEQLWIAKRDTFALFGSMVFCFGSWDSGGRCAFNSESFFHQYCIANHITHWACIESTAVLFNTTHPGTDEVTEDPSIFSLLR